MTFDPSEFVGYRVKFHALGDEYVGILAYYSSSTDRLFFKQSSVYIIENGKLDAVSDYSFPRRELYPVFNGSYMVKDERDGGKFNKEVLEKKLKVLKLEEEEEGEEEEKPVVNVSKMNVTNCYANGNGAVKGQDGVQGHDKAIQLLEQMDLIETERDERRKSASKLEHIINGHPSDSSSSSEVKSLSSLSSDDTSPPKSTLSIASSITNDSNLPRAPDHDQFLQWLAEDNEEENKPIKDLFAKCEEEEKEPIEFNEEDAFNSITNDVEYWPGNAHLPLIEDVTFVDLRKDLFITERCEELVNELLNYDQISFDVFGESISRDNPIEYIAICGGHCTESEGFDLTIYLFPLQLTNKITKMNKNVIGIMKSVINSRITKLVHCCVFMAEALKERHDIDIRLPLRSLIDTSILDAKHREDMALRKTLPGYKMKQDILLRSLDDCLQDYLDIEMTAEYFPNYQKDEEYLCLHFDEENPQLTNTAKNYLIRKVGLLFTLEAEIKNRLFGIIDSGTQMLASKLISSGGRQASELRLTYKHHGIKAKTVLVAQDEDQTNLEKLIGHLTDSSDNKITFPKTNGHQSKPVTNGATASANGSQASGQSDVNDSGHELLSSPEEYPEGMLYDVINQRRRNSVLERGQIDWGTPQVPTKAPPPGGTEYKLWKLSLEEQSRRKRRNHQSEPNVQEFVVENRSRIEPATAVDVKLKKMVPTSAKCPGLRRKQCEEQLQRFRNLKAAEVGILNSHN